MPLPPFSVRRTVTEDAHGYRPSDVLRDFFGMELVEYVKALGEAGK